MRLRGGDDHREAEDDPSGSSEDRFWVAAAERIGLRLDDKAPRDRD